MTPLSQDLRLFGIDLRSGVQGLATLWDQVLRSPPFTWLYTPAAVALLRTDGSIQRWQDGREVRNLAAVKPVGRPSFHAVEIDDSVVLRHTVTMPVMPLAQVSDALALEVQTISPFAPDKLVWGWQLRPSARTVLQLDVALASRTHIERLLPEAAQRLGVEAQGLEVWVLPLFATSISGAALPLAPFVMQGFGETARHTPQATACLLPACAERTAGRHDCPYADGATVAESARCQCCSFRNPEAHATRCVRSGEIHPVC